MGFLWSLHFAHHVNLRKMRSLSSLSLAHPITDRGPPWVIKKNSDGGVFYVYVDNLGSFDQTAEKVEKVIEEASESFDKDGLLLHE